MEQRARINRRQLVVDLDIAALGVELPMLGLEVEREIVRDVPLEDAAQVPVLALRLAAIRACQVLEEAIAGVETSGTRARSRSLIGPETAPSTSQSSFFRPGSSSGRSLSRILRRLGGDDVQGAGDRVLAEQDRLRPAQNFDTFDVEEGARACWARP